MLSTFAIAAALTIIQLILFFGHWFLYKTLVRFLEITNSNVIFNLKITLFLLALSFITATLIASRYFNIFTRIFYTIAAGWLGMLYFLFWACLFSWIGYWIIKISNFPINQKFLTAALLLLALLTAIYGIINANIVRTNIMTVQIQNIPDKWRGKTATWVSDAHLGQVRNINFANYIAQKITKVHPDIVFIVGDLYDGGATANLEELAKPFGKVPATEGVYFITGNHEEFGDNSRYLKAIKEAGIKLLFNEMIKIDGLQIIGVDYDSTIKSGDFEAVLKKININKNKPSILLKHAPFDIDISERAGISLQLSGHTHRGQIFPISLITNAVYHGFDYGLKKSGNFTEYTSSGAGTWGPPVRFGNHPEIVVMRFE